MSIPTQLSLAGFIASDPDLRFTSAGAEYVRVRVGVEQWHKEVDGSFTKLDPTFHDMVAFESTARETYARFRKGVVAGLAEALPGHRLPGSPSRVDNPVRTKAQWRRTCVNVELT